MGAHRMTNEGRVDGETVSFCAYCGFSQETITARKLTTCQHPASDEAETCEHGYEIKRHRWWRRAGICPACNPPRNIGEAIDSGLLACPICSSDIHATVERSTHYNCSARHYPVEVSNLHPGGNHYVMDGDPDGWEETGGDTTDMRFYCAGPEQHDERQMLQRLREMS